MFYERLNEAYGKNYKTCIDVMEAAVLLILKEVMRKLMNYLAIFLRGVFIGDGYLFPNSPAYFLLKRLANFRKLKAENV